MNLRTMKLFTFAFSLITFTAILCGIYSIHARYFAVDVVLYSAIADVLIAVTLFAIGLYRVRIFRVFTNFEKFQVVVIALLLGGLLAIVFPTIIDRSLSFYILEKLQQRGGGIKLDRFEEVIAKEYLKEHQLINIRLTEQTESGTITIHNGCVKLTEHGRNLAEFSRYFRMNLLPKQRLIMNEYSDELTDPFRESGPVNDYGCNN